MRQPARCLKIFFRIYQKKYSTWPLGPATVRELHQIQGAVDLAAALGSEEQGRLKPKGTVGAADGLWAITVAE